MKYKYKVIHHIKAKHKNELHRVGDIIGYNTTWRGDNLTEAEGALVHSRTVFPEETFTIDPGDTPKSWD